MLLNIKKIWSFLLPRERKMALVLLGVILLSGLASVAMIASVGPFLILLSDPDALTTNSTILMLRRYAGNPDQTETLLILALGSGAMILAGTALNLFRVYAVARFTHMRAHAISTRTFSINLQQPYEEFMETRPAVFVRRTVGEPNEVVNQFLMPLGNFISSAITSIMMLGFLFWFNPYVTLGVIAFFFLSFGILSIFTKERIKILGIERIEHSTRRGHILQEIVRCFRDIRMSGQEIEFIHRFDRTSMDVSKNQIKVKILQQIPKYWVQMLFLGSVITLSTAFLMLSSNDQSFIDYLPMIGVFVLSGQRLLPEIQTLYLSKNTMLYGGAAVEKMYSEYHYLKNNQRPVVKSSKRLPLNEEITLEKVQYTYRDGTKGLPEPVSLFIKKGEKIGIVGESGSGKSTILSIIMGLFETTEGALKIDGEQLTQETMHEWRQSVSQVPQQVAVLDTTLKSNIAIGVEPDNIDESRVYKALKMAQLGNWVDNLPDGLNTELMKGTAALSGGQQQRIGIARALYRNTDVIILDEATSALDEKTEKDILTIFDKALADKTVISVAHRVNTLKNCDRIIKLGDNGIVFEGTWPEYNETLES